MRLSTVCPWVDYPLHRSKFPRKKDLGKQKFDVFNLMQIMEAVRKGYQHPHFRHGLEHYRKKVADAWGLEALPLKSGPGEDRGDPRRAITHSRYARKAHLES